ncbi:thiamine phosphate synthase [bacterium]|nr:thiamine phosphate synthase [bacterium]
MKIKGLYVILENSLFAEEVLQGGCRIIQLRNKRASTLQLYEEAMKLRELTNRYNALLIINDRIDIALSCEADGVHLGKEDLPLPVARKLMGKRIIGFSVDNLEEALKAQSEGADYVSLGPIFPTTSKADAGQPVGLKELANVRHRIHIPLVAIGGLNRYNLIEVVKNGADAVAVISAVSQSPSPRQAVEELISLFNKAMEEFRMKVKIKFEKSKIEVEGELFDTKIGRALFDALPIRSEIDKWGKEIYFSTGVECQPENLQEKVELGDMGYWPPENAWCIFFGPTPISKEGEIIPDSPVEVFGKAIGDLKPLNKVKRGDTVIIEKL